ncbi:MAG: HlyC/CorC family transporter [Ruminococcus sp.]|nr:HlyC/CorC family transporter [Ruminococcus sp.]
MALQMILLIVLITLSAALTLAESAIIAVNDARLEKLASGGEKRAVRLKKLTDKPGRFLAAMHSAVTVFGYIAAAYAAYRFSGPLAAALEKAFGSSPALRTVSVILIALVLAFVMEIFGETVPRKAAARDPEKLAMRLSGPAAAAVAFFSPFVWLTGKLSRGILRIMGIDPDREPDAVTEEEILMMSDAGAENGTIDEDENRIIKNVFAFDDMTAEQLCTHRTDVDVLWSEDSVEVWEETIHRTRHSVFPICGESVDNVIGLLNAKDYFRLDDKSRENIMKNAVREPYFVHENMKADRLFAQMKKKGADHFAVVADEYGGMSGIITVTDLVEQLVGDFDDDELDEPEAVMEQSSDGSWQIPGITALSEVCEALQIELPEEKTEISDTFGGYVIAELGEIPKDGTRTTLDTDGLHIEVQEIVHHRIGMCRVEILSPAETDEEQNG